jgi:hypothetical protein
MVIENGRVARLISNGFARQDGIGVPTKAESWLAPKVDIAKQGLAISVMLFMASQSFSANGGFPGWGSALTADDFLSPGLREAYRQVVSGFLQYCAAQGVRPSVAAARDYVELTHLEQGPSPVRLTEWKDGLNWFFR